MKSWIKIFNIFLVCLVILIIMVFPILFVMFKDVQPIATLLSGLLTGCLAFLGVVWSAKNVTKNSKESIHTNTVTKERIAWQNTLREKFVDYNKLIWEMFNETDRFAISKKNKKELSEKLRIKQTECQAVLSYIKLLLNPAECAHNKLQNELYSLFRNVSKVKMNSDNVDADNPLSKVEFLQQVLLKFEWRRIKEESETGKKHSQEKIDKLYKEIACNIDSKLAKDLLGFYDCCKHGCNCKCK
ncbi:hypothetical protein R0126_11935 [Bacillus stratosphericus]|nr:hypothetical protein R0126_11935 [Bacillus stratosphericus]